ncbi:hypothetical protein SCUP515_08812 [Seiridium cupressi]
MQQSLLSPATLGQQPIFRQDKESHHCPQHDPDQSDPATRSNSMLPFPDPDLANSSRKLQAMMPSPLFAMRNACQGGCGIILADGELWCSMCLPTAPCVRGCGSYVAIYEDSDICYPCRGVKKCAGKCYNILPTTEPGELCQSCRCLKPCGTKGCLSMIPSQQFWEFCDLCPQSCTGCGVAVVGQSSFCAGCEYEVLYLSQANTEEPIPSQNSVTVKYETLLDGGSDDLNCVVDACSRCGSTVHEAGAWYCLDCQTDAHTVANDEPVAEPFPFANI